MKDTMRLCRSIAKQNSAFTVGLLLLFVVTSIVIGVSKTVPRSMSDSVLAFNRDYNMPDAWFVTAPVSEAVNRFVEGTDGIEGIECGLVYDVKCMTETGEPFSLRAFSRQDDGFRKYHVFETKPAPDGVPTVWIPKTFAENNNITPGDTLKIRSGEVYKDFFVESIVSIPESITCRRNDISWSTHTDFAHIYLDKAELQAIYRDCEPDMDLSEAVELILQSGNAEDLIDKNGVTNFWSFWFEENMSPQERQETYDRISLRLKDAGASGELYETSSLYENFQKETRKIYNFCTYSPGLMLFIGLGMSYLFIALVIESNRKKIGLLKALGYTKKQILFVFITYNTSMCLLGIIAGYVISVVISIPFLEIFRGIYELPKAYYSPDIIGSITLYILMLVISVLSCLIKGRVVFEVQPAEAYSDMEDISTDPVPRWLTGLKLGAMMKTQVVSLFRKRRLLWISSIGLAASVVLTVFCCCFIDSSEMQETALFGEKGRFRYDFIVDHDTDCGFREAAAAVDGAAAVEPITAFRASIRSEHEEINKILVNAIDDEGQLIIPGDIHGNRVYHKDGIILDNYTAEKLKVREGDTVYLDDIPLTVNAIACEVRECRLYISHDAAAALGYEYPNQTGVKIAENADASAIRNILAEIPGHISTTVLVNQHRELKSEFQIQITLGRILTVLMFMLGILIVYNLVLLNVNRRKREYAIMRSLGVPLRKIAGISLLESLSRFVISILIGIPAGILIVSLVFARISNDNIYYPLIHLKQTILMNILLSLLYVAAWVLMTIIRVKKIDPAIALNARE